MAFDLEPFGNCCVAKVIDGWMGENEVHYFNNRRVTNYEEYKVWATEKLKAFCDDVNEREYMDEDQPDDFNDLRNLAVFVAVLRSDQVWALKFAQEVGFTRTRALKKGRYNEDATMRLLWISSLDLYDWYYKN